MILLYALVLLLLGVALFLTRRRASGLERKYYRAAAEAERLAQHPAYRPGKASRADALQSARRQYELGRLVQKRDRLEAKFDYWQGLAKRLGRRVATVRSWQGRKMPYTMGVLDVMTVLYVVDEFTVGRYVSVKQLVQTVASLLQ